MKKITIILSALIILSSCTKSFYQIYTTEAPSLEQKGNVLTYENDDCQVNYNLWAENGNPCFTIYNKTNKDLFIVLSQSFFIKNSVAYDYFQNREFEKANSLSLTMSKTGLSSLNSSSGVIFKEMPIVCIPPKSFKTFGEYSILKSPIRNCDKRQAYPQKISIPIQFTKDDSPINFKNRIAYSFDKDGININNIENEFWISEITNYSKKMAGKEMMIKECEEDPDIEFNKKYVFNIFAPNKFYNFYKGKRGFNNNNKNKGKLVTKDDMYK